MLETRDKPVKAVTLMSVMIALVLLIGCRARVDRPPSVSQPSGPATAQADTVYTFTAAASDPDGDRVAVRFCWGDGDTSDWSALYVSDYPIPDSHAWDSGGTYAVAAQAREVGGKESDWSPALVVSVLSVPPLKWRFQTGARIDGPPAIGSDGTIYVQSDSVLYALNPDGTLRWRNDSCGRGWGGVAVGADGTIYVGTYGVHAISGDGAVRWHYFSGPQVANPSVGPDGTIHVTEGAYGLTALNPDGTQRWVFSTYPNWSTSAAIGPDSTIYFGSWDNYLYALNPDGSLRWRYDAGDDVETDPTIGANGEVYFGTGTCFYALLPGGSLKWRYDAGSAHAAIGADGTIFVGLESRFCALNPDGTRKWVLPNNSIAASSPALSADGTIYFGTSYSPYIYALNSDGTVKWRFPTGDCVYSSPAIADDGTVYVGSWDGYLYAFEGSSPLANSPWPKFHHDNKNTGRAGGP